jgi:mannan endo-1,4-beta-mannosidase
VLATSTRNNNIKNWAAQITAAGVPWLYWEVIPNANPHGVGAFILLLNTWFETLLQYSFDFEIGVGDASWSTLKTAALAAAKAPAAFDFSAYLL